MDEEPERTRRARAAAEEALVRVVHHYGSRPEFVVLGGLVPEILCSQSRYRHAGTSDVDVQVDLEIACGTVNGRRLEQALRDADFEPSGSVWRWESGGIQRAVVKFELLADQPDLPAGSLTFKGCNELGAANLRGTGFAARDVIIQTLRSNVDDALRTVEVNVTGLAGFLLAKSAAARSRHKDKDWYDIAFVLQHNDAGGPEAAADEVLSRFRDDLVGVVHASFDYLIANFRSPADPGPRAYASQMQVDHSDVDASHLCADAVLAVEEFYSRLFPANARGDFEEE